MIQQLLAACMEVGADGSSTNRSSLERSHFIRHFLEGIHDFI